MRCLHSCVPIMKHSIRTAGTAWVATAVFYFYQYALRTAPSVMMPELAEGFALTSFGVAALLGVFYYGYSPFSLIAGVALDRLGARGVVPVGALLAATGAFLFGTSTVGAAQLGRFMQGAGGVFALVGAVYIATINFPASRAATLIGATQMFGMAGGSAGQFLVGPIIAAGISLRSFWFGMGVIGLFLAALLYITIPVKVPLLQPDDAMKGTARSIGTVLRNPQSIICGLIAGLLFLPTTILGMTWGVRFLQQAHGFDYGEAVIRSAALPVGWMIGCPLLGALSDRLGRRKSVIAGGASVLFACVAWVLYGNAGFIPPYVVGIVMGIASGAAMLPYTVIKESQPPQLGGTATGVINFLIFTLSAVAGPVFAWAMQVITGAGQPAREHYQTTFRPLLYAVAVAMVLTLFLRETGTANPQSKQLAANASI